MKKVLLIGTALTLGLALAGCQGTDVVGKVAVTSFGSVIEKQNANIATDEANNGWALSLQDGKRFVWGKDFSTAGTPDLMMEFDATPFLNAGLDPLKLDKEMYLYDESNKLLMVHSELGSEAFSYNGEAKPLDSFTQLVKNYRDSIGYHEVLDHYGVAFGNGNMVEWAKDMATNDKDLVFVLNPQPFIDAGVDPAKVTDWVFAQVEVKNDKGEKELVDKFLSPYNFE